MLWDERDDHDRFLRWLKVVYANPSILGVAARNEARSRSELAAGLAAAEGRYQPTIDADVIATFALATLDVAFAHWQHTDAQQGLGHTIADAYSAVTSR